MIKFDIFKFHRISRVPLLHTHTHTHKTIEESYRLRIVPLRRLTLPRTGFESSRRERTMTRFNYVFRMHFGCTADRAKTFCVAYGFSDHTARRFSMTTDRRQVAEARRPNGIDLKPVNYHNNDRAWNDCGGSFKSGMVKRTAARRVGGGRAGREEERLKTTQDVRMYSLDRETMNSQTSPHCVQLVNCPSRVLIYYSAAWVPPYGRG